MKIDLENIILHNGDRGSLGYIWIGDFDGNYLADIDGKQLDKLQQMIKEVKQAKSKASE